MSRRRYVIEVTLDVGDDHPGLMRSTSPADDQDREQAFELGRDMVARGIRAGSGFWPAKIVDVVEITVETVETRLAPDVRRVVTPRTETYTRLTGDRNATVADDIAARPTQGAP
jgi:hypothetical protein